MNPQTYLFIGRSGCGKGTQAQLLEKLLKQKMPNNPLVHLETGKLFRDFFHGKSYTHALAHDIYERGALQPEFLTVHLWSDFFVAEMKKDANLIVDGTPRRLNEATILHTAFEFYGLNKPNIIYINVSREHSETRMLERKREDDTKQDIEMRLNWFDADVMPTIEYYRKNSFYSFHEIDGNKPVAEVQADIVKSVGLL